MKENFYNDTPLIGCVIRSKVRSIKRHIRYRHLAVLGAFILFIMPGKIFAQAPNLGTAANYVLFTSVGAVTHSGISNIIGNVGSNSGSSTGFGNVNGVMNNNNGATAACAADLNTAYGQLNSAIPTFTPSSLLGNGATLVAGVYHITSAATLNLALNLDGQGNANALFIFQIDGSFSANTLASVHLLNGALACNVFWKVEGLVSIASNVTMRGTIVANNAAINLNTGDTLEGRALSTDGAVTVSGIIAYTPIGCGSTYLTGPAAPNLLSTAAYGVFSGNGPVTNTGVTHITGDVGTNVGLTTGFNPLFVTGTIHPIPDASTTAAAADIVTVYNYLNNLPYDIMLLYPAQFGNGLTLTPHTYQMNAATTFTGTVYLDAEGDANAVFVIKINGALTTGTFSRVVLLNGAQAKNVYWKIDGAVNINNNSLFNGTMIANNGAITTGTNDTVNGRVMTTDGAVNIQASNISITPPPCTAPPIAGITHGCVGTTNTLTDPTSGGRWTSSSNVIATIDSISGVVTSVSPGNVTITYVTSAGCVSMTADTVNALPAPIVGPGVVCTGTSITLTDLTGGGTWSSSNIAKATVGSATGIVTGVATGTPFIIYTLPTTCFARKTISVNADPGAITGPSTVCTGSFVTLTDTATGGVWSSSNTHATVVNGVVTGITAGLDTIIYSVTNICGTATTSTPVTVNPQPSAGTISGPSSVCAGTSITLTDGVAGGLWTSTNANATVTPTGGVVTGILAGADTIIYSVTNTCGTATARAAITVNPQPNAGTISGPSSVCVGASITLTDGIAGGTWSSSNATATVTTANGLVTGVSAGTDTVFYSVTNTCGTATSPYTITVNPQPNAGTISGPSSVCVGTSITLTDGVAGGTWSSFNTDATVTITGGVVTGVSPGTDAIIYRYSNVCGTATTQSTITVNPQPNAGTISGPSSVCVGASITLTDGVAGGTWSSFNTDATVTITGGVVTGVSPGTDAIIYRYSNVCGTATTQATITINPQPDAGTISGPSSVCAGTTITLTDGATGGTWSASNTNALVLNGVVTGVTAGTDNILYTVTNVCNTAVANFPIVVDPQPSAGTISGPTGVCIGSTITLTDAIAGGTWTASNATATIVAGSVKGISVGIDTITYSVTNMCNTAIVTEAINVFSLPTVPEITTMPLASVCTGTMYQNFGTSTPAPAFTTYYWSATNANVWAQGTGRQYALVSFDTAGTAYVTLNVTTTGTACTDHRTVPIVVSSSIAQTPSVTYFTYHFVCTPNDENSYQWGYDDINTLDSTILTGEIDQDYLIVNPDYANKIYWAMTNTGGCLQKTYFKVPTTVQNVGNTEGITVYPNPAGSVVNVTVSSATNGLVQVDVMNMLGQTTSTVQTMNNRTSIDIAALPVGYYMVICYRDGVKIATARFVKN